MKHRNALSVVLAGSTLVFTDAAIANIDAADTTNAIQLWVGGSSGYDLTGAGVTVGIWEALDGGEWEIRATHEQFIDANGNSRVTFGDPNSGGTAGHATHVASTLGGAHIPGKRDYWGMAPQVQIVSFSSALDEDELRFEASGFGIDISNHSYGTNTGGWSQQSWDIPDGNGGSVSRTYETWQFGPDWFFNLYDETPSSGRYSNSAFELDRALHENPKLLSFWSAGNSRTNDYDDVQGDGKFVARFQPSYIDSVGVVGLQLDDDGWYLVSQDDYDLPGWDGDGNGRGYDSLSFSRTAKNILTIGSTLDHYDDPHNGDTVALNGFTNFGPTDDGRLGVDLVANGNSVSGANDTSDTSYTTRSGTSFSSPNAAGTAALVLEYWRRVRPGTPDSATQKGLLMHTATDVVSFGQVGPDYRSGFGLVNGLAAVEHLDDAFNTPLTERMHHVIEGTLSEGGELTFDFFATGDPVSASLSWIDPASNDNLPSGLDDRTIQLIHDLDLWITDEFGNMYYPWTLDPENPDDPAVQTARNQVDNFEQVWTDEFLEGEWFTVHVGHSGSLVWGDQAFGLFVSGALIPEPASALVLAVPFLVAHRRRRHR
ncbi:MAG: S8 family serine peptidase [Planctomycetota bacterium]